VNGSELPEEKFYAWGRAYQIEESLAQQNTIEDVAIFDPMELPDGVQNLHLFNMTPSTIEVQKTPDECTKQ
jgi:hypothetical protein